MSSVECVASGMAVSLGYSSSHGRGWRKGRCGLRKPTARKKGWPEDARFAAAARSLKMASSAMVRSSNDHTPAPTSPALVAPATLHVSCAGGTPVLHARMGASALTHAMDELPDDHDGGSCSGGMPVPGPSHGAGPVPPSSVWNTLPVPCVRYPLALKCCGSVVHPRRTRLPRAPEMNPFDSTVAFTLTDVALYSLQLPPGPRVQPAHSGSAVHAVAHCAAPPPSSWCTLYGAGAPANSVPGSSTASAWRMWFTNDHVCVWWGYLPVKKLMRDGEHTAMVQYARSNVTPRVASAWIPGVTIHDAPYGATSGRKSSTRRYSTFLAPGGAGDAGAASRALATGRMRNDDAHDATSVTMSVTLVKLPPLSQQQPTGSVHVGSPLPTAHPVGA